MNDYAPQGPRPHRGAMILTFGIVGFLCCFIFAILAWVMGGSDLKEMAAGRMDRAGEGQTRAGWILGIIATILGILGLLGVIAAIAIPVLLSHRM